METEKLTITKRPHHFHRNQIAVRRANQQSHGEHNKITYQNSIRSNLLNWGWQDSNTYLPLSSEYINDRGLVSGRELKIFDGRIHES